VEQHLPVDESVVTHSTGVVYIALLILLTLDYGVWITIESFTALNVYRSTASIFSRVDRPFIPFYSVHIDSPKLRRAAIRRIFQLMTRMFLYTHGFIKERV
jgi:hypothetical protein